MATALSELIFRITPQAGDFKSTMAQVRSELVQTGQTQTVVSKSELSTRQQLAAASSLQRQRSAALIGEWKRTETAATNLARGVQPVATNLQKVTDIMQGLRGSAAVLEGPLGSVSGRLGSISTLAGGLGATGGPIAIAIAGLVAMTAAAVLLNVKLVELGVSTADWQGKFQDMSQQAGVTVETLSGLEVAFSTTGGNIDTAVQSLIIFQSKMVDAGDATSKTGKLFKELGITSTDTDQALRQAVAGLHAMGEGFKQTDAARDLFGRGAKSFLAITKETNGDLDKLIDKLRAMGVLLSGDAAKSADEFNDQLAILQFQLRGVGAVVGREMLPPILSALQSLGKLINENQAAIQLMGSAVRVLIAQPMEAWLRGNFYWLNQLGDALNYVTSRNWSITYSFVNVGGAIIPIPSGLMGTEKPTFGEAAGSGLGRQGGGGGGGKGGGKGGGARQARNTDLTDATKDAALAEREILQSLAVDIEENKRSLDGQARDIEEFTHRAIELLDKKLEVTRTRYDAEHQALEAALNRKEITQREYEQKIRELDLDEQAAKDKHLDDIWELEDRRDKQLAAARLASYQREFEMAEEAGERLIRQIEDRVDRGIIAESEGARQIAVIIAESYDRKKKALEEEVTYLHISLERKAAITDELIALDFKRAEAAENASQRIIDALKKEADAAMENLARKGAAGASEGLEKRSPAEGGFLSGLETGQLAELEEGVRSFEDVATVAFSAVGAAVNGLAQGIGGLVESWVLLGSAGPNAMRKMVASVLAGVAAESAVLAIFELAKGFAALFFNPAEAAAHFQAAALFGSLALVTAVAGRAVAGNAFQKDSGSPGGGGSGGSRSGSSERAGPSTLDVNRRAMAQAAPPAGGEFVLKISPPEGWLGKEFRKDYTLNGVTRLIIKSDGQG